MQWVKDEQFFSDHTLVYAFIAMEICDGNSRQNIFTENNSVKESKVLNPSPCRKSKRDKWSIAENPDKSTRPIAEKGIE